MSTNHKCKFALKSLTKSASLQLNGEQLCSISRHQQILKFKVQILFILTNIQQKEVSSPVQWRIHRGALAPLKDTDQLL